MKKEKKIFIIALIGAFLLALLPILTSSMVSDVRLTIFRGTLVYPWQTDNKDMFVILTIITLTLIHLVGNFYLIRKRLKNNSREVTKGNIALLVFNLVMVLAHLAESIFLYDGLAIIVPVWTSQLSVIIMLVIIIIMRSGTRGIFFGWGPKLNSKAQKLLYKYHGILFVMALVYTFWYHPMVNTIGHFTGFFYMYLLFIQVSFVKVKQHQNIVWTTFLEVFVALHGFTVAYFLQNSALWSMFVFGFLFIFVVTQIEGLTKSCPIKTTIRIIYIIVVVIYYSFVGYDKLYQITWIPLIELGSALILMYILKLFTKDRKIA